MTEQPGGEDRGLFAPPAVVQSESVSGLEPAPDLLDTTPRFSNRRLLVGGVALVVAVVLALGTVAVVDRFRRGASSPQDVAVRLVAAADDGDLARAAALVEPGEAASLLRLARTLGPQLDRLGLAAALDPTGAAGTGVSLDGLRLIVADASPEVRPLSADAAVVVLRSGTLRVRVEPTEARGLLRSWLVLTHQGEAVNTTSRLADFNGGSGLRLVVLRTQGRWYLSPTLTLLEATRADGDVAEAGGALPDGSSARDPGSASPEEAAATMTGAAARAYAGHDPAVLGRALDRVGALALSRYGRTVVDGYVADPDPSLTLDHAVFRSEPQGADRATALVEDVVVRNDRGTARVDPSCVRWRRDAFCPGAGAYAYEEGVPQLRYTPLLRRGPTFGVTTVRTDEGWKVGFVDSLADGVANLVGSLSREQVLALLGRAQDDTSGGPVEPDRTESVTFNSAGYAVRTLHVERGGRFRLVDHGRGSASSNLFGADGEETPQDPSGGDSTYRLAPGDYTVVAWAGPGWSRFPTSSAATAYREPLDLRRLP